MHYPQYAKAKEYRVSVPRLSGGINQAEAANIIGDDQLSDGCNVWWKNGKLRTRPVMRPVETNDLSSYATGQALSDLHLFREQTAIGSLRGHHAALTFGSDDRARFGIIGVDANGQFHEHASLISYPQAGESHALYIEAGGSAGNRDRLLMVNGDLYKLSENGYIPTEPHVPTLIIEAVGNDQNILSDPGGYPFESRNLLTDAFKVAYAVREGGLYFHLPPSIKNVSGTLTVACTDADGNTVTHTLRTQDSQTHFSPYLFVENTDLNSTADGYFLHYAKNKATFWFVAQGLSATRADDMDTSSYTKLVATFTPDNNRPSGKTLIGRMTFGTWYGGDRSGLAGGTRFFVAGNPAKPNLVHYSALNNPTYFPENSYAYIGASSDPITAFGKQADRLLIFKQREIYCADYVATELGADSALAGGLVDAETQSAVFPITPLSSGIGCDCPDTLVLCANRLVWLTSEGKVYTLVTDNAYSEQNVREIGQTITPLLKAIPAWALRKAMAADYDGYYLLAAEQEVFLFDYTDGSRYTAQSKDILHKKLTWYRWRLPCAPTALFAVNDSLILLAIGYADPAVPGNRCCLTSYALTPGDADVLCDYGSETAGYAEQPRTRSIPLTSYLVTKQFDFDMPEQYKHVRLLTLTAGSMTTQLLRVRFADEKGLSRDEIRLYTGGDATLRMLPGMRRVRQLAVRVDTTGEVWYDGLSIRYHTFYR